MAIEDRNLSAGTQRVATYHKTRYTCEVVEQEGQRRFRLATGQTFKSPSSAGKAVMDGKSCNGWAFWRVATEETSSSPAKRGRKPKAAATPETEPATDLTATEEPTHEAEATASAE